MKKILLASLLSIGLIAAEIETPCEFSKKQYEISKKKMTFAMQRKSALTAFHVGMTLNYIENILSECKLSKEEEKHFMYGRKLLIDYKKQIKEANRGK